MSRILKSSFISLILLSSSVVNAGYNQTNIVGSDSSDHPRMVDPTLANAWGIAIRPAGAGGHFWIASPVTGQSVEFVGEVGGIPLFQDTLKTVNIPGPNGSRGQPTGVVFNGSTNLVITQAQNGGPVTAPAKFLFAGRDGILSAWTERDNGNGTFDRTGDAVIAVDRSSVGSQFFGVGLNTAGDRLYAADFGVAPAIRTYDGTFADISPSSPFINPFVSGPISVGDFAAFNVQSLTIGSRTGVFASFIEYLGPGIRGTGAGLGRLVEYGEDGSLTRVWNDRGMLNQPWGLAVAPAGFGKFSGKLLVSNFGDGTIVAFDPKTHKAIDFVRDINGTPISIDGLWGLQFGNGVALGDANALFFAARPHNETQGLFGKITFVPEPGTWSMLIAGFGLTGAAMRRRRMVPSLA